MERSLHGITASLFFISFIKSFMINLISELGDNTFMISTILSTKHPSLPIFIGTIIALSLVALVSSILGKFVSSISYNLIQYIAIITYIFYGIKMMIEGYGMRNDQALQEYKEIKDRLTKISREVAGNITPTSPSSATDDEGTLAGCGQAELSPACDGGIGRPPRLATRLSRYTPPEYHDFLMVACEAFALNFMAEFGDRSQISTIALGSQHNVFGVTAGAIAAYILCIALAVYMGKCVVRKISLKLITYVGACIYLIFAVMSIRTAVTSK